MITHDDIRQLIEDERQLIEDELRIRTEINAEEFYQNGRCKNVLG